LGLLGKAYTLIRKSAQKNQERITRKRYQIHPSVSIGRDTQIYGEGEITIGEGTHIGNGCFIHAPAGRTIRIGKRVEISHYVDIRALEGDISIGDDAAVYAKSFVKGGIRIGKSSVLGALSIATHSIPDGEVWGGVPARVIRTQIHKDKPNH
jgi:acetyltransferase-like isoleucine patch superfamily enzyme